MKKIISVIIPHYNSYELVHKAIKSAASAPEVEVIVVDDKSDLSKECFEELEKFCDELGVIFLKNDTEKKGAGVCRNIALKHATGKWLIFLDSDDYFVENWYDMVKEYLDGNGDMIYFAPTSIDLHTGELSTRHITYKELVNNYCKKPNEKNEIALRYRFCNVCAKIIRKSIVDENNIWFDEVVASNDVMFMTKCAYNSKRIKADNRDLYVITRSGMTLTSKKNEKNFMVRIDVLIARYKYLEERLSRKQFKMAHIDWYALARIVDAIAEKWGIRKVIELLALYKKNNIKWFDISLLNPIVLFNNIKIEVLWWLGIKGSRRRK